VLLRHFSSTYPGNGAHGLSVAEKYGCSIAYYTTHKAGTIIFCVRVAALFHERLTSTVGDVVTLVVDFRNLEAKFTTHDKEGTRVFEAQKDLPSK
jgi:hypothetical protein